MPPAPARTVRPSALNLLSPEFTHQLILEAAASTECSAIQLCASGRKRVWRRRTLPGADLKCHVAAIRRDARLLRQRARMSPAPAPNSAGSFSGFRIAGYGLRMVKLAAPIRIPSNPKGDPKWQRSLVRLSIRIARSVTCRHAFHSPPHDSYGTIGNCRLPPFSCGTPHIVAS